VITANASSFSMIITDGCSTGAPADDAGFCAPCLVAVVPPWKHCISAVIVMFWLPENHASGESELIVCGTCSLSCQLEGLYPLHKYTSIRHHRFQGRTLSGSTYCGDRILCLGFLVRLVGLLISLSLTGLCFIASLGYLYGRM
jgi:hypothetical protein